MATTVTVSEFRENLSKYIDLVNEKGKEVIIVDGRKGKVLGKFVKEKKKKVFDWDNYVRFVESLGGSGILSSKEDEESRRKFRETFNKGFEKE